MSSLLFDPGVSAQKDRDHYFRDWESNIDGHLMRATGKYLEKNSQDFEGFKEYMRAVFKRPFVQEEQVTKWFECLGDRLSGDEDVREGILKNLAAELDL